jgi:hypothetical protein
MRSASLYVIPALAAVGAAPDVQRFDLGSARATLHGTLTDQIDELRSALFDESLGGIRRSGDVWPLGAFLLVGAMIDTLAGLRFAPPNDFDGKQGRRYAEFVHEYFSERYVRLGMGDKLWKGLRCRPLHNFSAEGIIQAGVITP